MATKTKTNFNEDYDQARDMRGLTAAADGYIMDIVRFKEMTGEGFGTAVDNAIDIYASLRLEVVPAERAKLLAATEALDAIVKGRRAQDAETVLAQVRKGQKVSLTGDGQAAAEDALAAQQRVVDALNVATSAQRRFIESLMAEGDKAMEVIGGVYAATVAWEPTSATTYGDVVAHDSTSAKVIDLCLGLSTAVQGGRSAMTKQEAKLLRGQFVDLPPTMPTLETVRKALRGMVEATSGAQAIEAAQASKAAQKVENRITAQAAARARVGSKTESETAKA